MNEKICVLGKDWNSCTTAKCARCGWNIRQIRWRAYLLRRFGLTRCSDGLRRLVIPAPPEGWEAEEWIG